MRPGPSGTHFLGCGIGPFFVAPRAGQPVGPKALLPALTAGLTALTLSLTVLVGASAFGREPSGVEGPGFLITRSTVLHPSSELEVGYDTNTALSTEAVGSPFTRLLLRLDWASRPPQRLPGVGSKAARQKIDFRIGLGLERRDYFVREARSLSAWQFDEAARLTVNPQGNVAATVAAQYVRTLLPRNYEPFGPYMRDVVLTQAGGIYRSGRYELTLAYEFQGDFFENEALRYGNSLRHTARFVGRREILPKLLVGLEITQSFLLHEDVETVLRKADSRPLTILAFGQGMLRPRLRGVLKLGYTNGFYEKLPTLRNKNASLPVAELEAGWQFMQTARLAGGAMFQPQDALTGNYYMDAVAYGRYDQMVVIPRFRPIIGSLRAAYRHRMYRGMPIGFMDRSDDILQITARLEVSVKTWLHFAVGYYMSADFTDFEDPAGITYRYVRHEVFAAGQVSY